ncbi:MAG: class I SAM-dependent methyltransferase [Selenomonadaceae bacterium]|nr:class I SAM-dependent methyltransferase [Selenomonadaceae bacterium]
MKKAYIWGSGSTGNRLFHQINDKEILGFLDNDKSKWGGVIEGIKILGGIDYIKEIPLDSYDEIIIGTMPGLETVSRSLAKIGIPWEKINTSYLSDSVKARENFLESFARLYNSEYKDDVCVAEGGVYQGDFAKLINKCFPNRKLYLFDTFEGFAKSDVEMEEANNNIKFSEFKAGHLSNTDENLVINKMSVKDKVSIVKGFFPDTLKDFPEQKYIFVNLDFDLYLPTLAGLRYFAPRLVKNGIILIHDYFNPGYPGVEQAVREFAKETGVRVLPIGDRCSVMIGCW